MVAVGKLELRHESQTHPDTHRAQAVFDG
jgi:hypothetical protein